MRHSTCHGQHSRLKASPSAAMLQRKSASLSAKSQFLPPLSTALSRPLTPVPGDDMSMRALLLAALATCAAAQPSASPTIACKLAPGDLMFVGLSITDDEFAIMAATHLSAGTEFLVTDRGYKSDTDGFRGGEGRLIYTAPAGGLAPGELLFHSGSGASNFTTFSGTFNVRNTGEQVLIYEDCGSGINFINGMAIKVPWTPDNETVNIDAESHLPAQLATFNLEFNVAGDDRYYSGTTTAQMSDLQALINDESNWVADGTDLDIVFAAGFTVLATESPSLMPSTAPSDTPTPATTASPTVEASVEPTATSEAPSAAPVTPESASPSATPTEFLCTLSPGDLVIVGFKYAGTE
eukprot:scaffold806_cov229-Pinguiococcus_pyrenoidosus.AAC.1